MLALMMQFVGVAHASVTFVVPALALAQLFCWWSVLTHNQLGHMIEESLWALTGCLIAGNLGYHFWCTPDNRLLIGMGAGLATLYSLYMVLVDIPMYLRKYRVMPVNEYSAMGPGLLCAIRTR